MTSLLKTDPDTYPYYCDGRPMADNTEQYRWIVIIKENLEILFADRTDVFIAGDLFWLPVEDQTTVRNAPDVMVVFGRPKGKRLAYKQWEEDNISPQVVFEIRSPSNTPKEMQEKFDFYQQYGVAEYYIYDPHKFTLDGWLRRYQTLEPILNTNDWVSPRLGIRLIMTTEELEIYHPDGRQFLTSLELEQAREQAEHWAEQAEQRAKQAEQARERTKIELEQERQQHRQLVKRLSNLSSEQLKVLGIDPEMLNE